MISSNHVFLFFGFILILVLFVSCSNKQSNFTQMPGFQKHFSENPSSENLPSKSEQALLEKYKPRVFLAKNQTKFIDFYQDYIANGSLYINGKLVSKKVDQALLNKHKDNPNAEFRFSRLNDENKTTPTVYGRVHQETLKHDGKTLPLTFLSYNIVFTHSGLVKGLAGWQRAAMGAINGNVDWHQLDHYVGLSVVLSEGKPIAVMLQQHNYQTTWLFSGKNSEGSVKLADDHRVEVDVAIQSNELYLHSPEFTKHPGLSFITENSIEFAKTGKNKPMMAGWDITHGEVEQDYSLKFLPSTDAFYTFKGKLGKGRKLPGRDGPPGADYATIPDLMPLVNRMITGYRVRDIETEKSKITGLFVGSSYTVKKDGLSAYARDFLADLEINKAND